MLKIAVGHSEAVNEADVAREIIEPCRNALDGLIPQAGIIYCAMDFKHQLILEAILAAFPEIQLIGCTTDGEISSQLGYAEDSVALMVFYSDHVQFATGLGTDLLGDVDKACSQAVDNALSKLDRSPQFCIALAESMTVGGVAVSNALKNKLGSNFPLFGGLAADQWRMEQTYQFNQNMIFTDSVQVLLFAGDIAFSSGVAYGWQPIGPKKSVTKAVKNVVYELDNEPILDFYNKYFGGNYTRLPMEYALAVFPANEKRFYIRSPAIFCESEKCITFFGDVPENITVQLVMATSDELTKASECAMLEALNAYPQALPDAALFFTCAARKAILGSRANTLLQARVSSVIQEPMPFKFPMSGFYTYGEFAPLTNGAEGWFHNGTIVIVLIGEKSHE